MLRRINIGCDDPCARGGRWSGAALAFDEIGLANLSCLVSGHTSHYARKDSYSRCPRQWQKRVSQEFAERAGNHGRLSSKCLKRLFGYRRGCVGLSHSHVCRTRKPTVHRPRSGSQHMNIKGSELTVQTFCQRLHIGLCGRIVGCNWNTLPAQQRSHEDDAPSAALDETATKRDEGLLRVRASAALPNAW